MDASGQILGRIATGIAIKLRGKHKPSFTPFIDGGDFVDVINAGQVRVTGKKLEQKFYFSHSGYAGGAKTTSLATLMERHPERVIYLAIKRMLPNNRLRARQLTRLRVYRNGKPGPKPAAKKQEGSK